MSKLELTKCDACGLVQGEDGRSEQMWAKVYGPSGGIVPESFGMMLAKQRHYCFNCWSEIEKTIPKLPERPCAPAKKAK